MFWATQFKDNFRCWVISRARDQWWTCLCYTSKGCFRRFRGHGLRYSSLAPFVYLKPPFFFMNNAINWIVYAIYSIWRNISVYSAIFECFRYCTASWHSIPNVVVLAIVLWSNYQLSILVLHDGDANFLATAWRPSPMPHSMHIAVMKQATTKEKDKAKLDQNMPRLL